MQKLLAKSATEFYESSRDSIIKSLSMDNAKRTPPAYSLRAVISALTTRNKY